MKMNLVFEVNTFCTCGVPLEVKVQDNSIFVSPCHKCRLPPKELTPEREREIDEELRRKLGPDDKPQNDLEETK